MTEEAWSEAEWQAFYAMADAFMGQANDLIGSEMTDQIAAAMLYACARFNTFAMQVQAGDPAGMDDAAVDFLTEELDSHLRDHMEERLCPDPGGRDTRVGGPDGVIGVLRSLDGRLEAEVSEFLSLADRFLDIANGMMGSARIGRISAALMHAATRFNVYAMQCMGHPPQHIDETLVRDFREIYVDLVHYHRQQTLIADPGQA